MQQEANFNYFYWCIKKFDTVLCRWMDNGMGFCMITMHTAGGMMERVRRRPRVTKPNKNYVHNFWGDDEKKKLTHPDLFMIIITG